MCKTPKSSCTRVWRRCDEVVRAGQQLRRRGVALTGSALRKNDEGDSSVLWRDTGFSGNHAHRGALAL